MHKYRFGWEEQWYFTTGNTSRRQCNHTKDLLKAGERFLKFATGCAGWHALRVSFLKHSIACIIFNKFTLIFLDLTKSIQKNLFFHLCYIFKNICEPHVYLGCPTAFILRYTNAFWTYTVQYINLFHCCQQCLIEYVHSWKKMGQIYLIIRKFV